MGTHGGWEGLVVKPGKAKAAAAAKAKSEKVKEEDTKGEQVIGTKTKKESMTAKKATEVNKRAEDKADTASKKRGPKKAQVAKDDPIEGTRRSKRIKVER